MNNQTTTLEQAAEQKYPYEIGYMVSEHNSRMSDFQDAFISGANYQKEQDEAKYKALLESHNELLEASKKAAEWMGENGGGYKVYDNLMTIIEKSNQQS